MLVWWMCSELGQWNSKYSCKPQELTDTTPPSPIMKILVYGKTKEQHDSKSHPILLCSRKLVVYLNREKSMIFGVSWFGHIVTQGSIQVHIKENPVNEGLGGTKEWMPRSNNTPLKSKKCRNECGAQKLDSRFSVLSLYSPKKTNPECVWKIFGKEKEISTRILECLPRWLLKLLNWSLPIQQRLLWEILIVMDLEITAKLNSLSYTMVHWSLNEVCLSCLGKWILLSFSKVREMPSTIPTANRDTITSRSCIGWLRASCNQITFPLLHACLVGRVKVHVAVICRAQQCKRDGFLF